MSIPYRIRRLLQRFAVVLLVLVIFSTAVLISWLLWLSRFVVYTDEGAKFDFSLSHTLPSGEVATPPAPAETVTITYADLDEPIVEAPQEFGRIVGHTVSADMLINDLDGVISALEALPGGTAVMLELKTLRGEFLYTTTAGRSVESIDITQVDRIIRTLDEKGCYLIADIPAFRDYWYFLDDEAGRVPYGLPRSGGNGALWLDPSGPSYWLNPASSGALNYLVQIITELRTFGFDEVLLRDFRFPDTDQIRFEGDRTEALPAAAKTLLQACSNDTFALSFSGTNLTLPEGRCRLYAEGVIAGDIPDFVAGLTLADPTVQLVFLTDLLDTRFEHYSVLRPLDVLHE